MSPLGQFPNFLTDGSRIRRPPVDDTKNPIFRLARRTSKDFRFTIHNLFFRTSDEVSLRAIIF